MNKIAIFLPTLRGGGAEASMVALANGLVKKGYQVDIILKKHIGEHSQAVDSTVRIINFNVPTMRYTLSRLVKYINQENPSTIISAMDLPNITAILARFFAKNKPKLISSLRGIISKQKPIYQKQIDRLIFRFFYPFADKIICVSNICANDAIQYLKLPKSKFQVIYNPVISDALFQKAREPIDYDWFDDPVKKTILTIGRLEEVKDHKTLINAFKLVRVTHEVQLIILGEGALREKITHMVTNLGLTQDVILPGFIPTPYNIIAHAQVFVLSSLHESFANVVTEALACQCPVVSTACGGPEEILDNGKYGHLVPIGDSQAMADAIIQVFNGDTRLPPLGWLEQFHADRNISQYIKLIEGSP